MYLLRSTIGAAVALALAMGPADAAPKGKAQAPSAVKASTKAPAVTKASAAPKAPKTTTAPKGGPKTTTTAKGGPKTTTGPTKTAKADAKLARAETHAAKSKKTGAAATTSTGTRTSSGVSTTEIDFTTGKVGERLSKNSALRSKLETQLRALGYEGTVYEAGYGYKNVGQLRASLNNVQNHQGLTFEQLKIQMTGLWVDPTGVVLRANLNPDGTITMVPLDQVTNPAPTRSLGQAKKTIATAAPPPVPISANR